MNKSSLIKAFFSTAGIQLVNKGVVLITGIFLARYLGPEEFGKYGFIMSLIVLATIPTVAGLPQLMTREIATTHLENRWGELKGLLKWSNFYILFMSIIAMAGLAVARYYSYIDEAIGSVVWIGLCLIPLRAFLSRQSAILNGLRFPVLSQLPQGVINNILALIFLTYFFVSENTLNSDFALFIQLLSSGIAFLISAYLVFKKCPHQYHEAKAKYKFKCWHKSLLPFSLLAIVGTLNIELASVFLGFLESQEAVAYFKVAVQGVVVLSLCLITINTITGPHIARLFRQGNLSGVQDLLLKSVRLSSLVCIPATLVLFIYGENIVVFFFGVDYIRASKLLSVMCVGQMVSVLLGPVGLVLQMTGNERVALRTLIITLIITVFLLVILIPLYQDMGAAISLTVGTILSKVLMTLNVNRLCDLKTWIR